MTKQILEAISAQMSETKVSKNSQYEFIKVKWCLTNLISFSAKQDQLLEKVRANSVVYIDFSRACDMISHNNPVLSKALLWLADWRKRFWLAVPGGWPGRAALAGCPGNIIRLASWGKSIWLAGLKGFGWLAGWLELRVSDWLVWDALASWQGHMLWLVDQVWEALVGWMGKLIWMVGLDWESLAVCLAGERDFGWLGKEMGSGWLAGWGELLWLAEQVRWSGWLDAARCSVWSAGEMGSGWLVGEVGSGWLAGLESLWLTSWGWAALAGQPGLWISGSLEKQAVVAWPRQAALEDDLVAWLWKEALAGCGSAPDSGTKQCWVFWMELFLVTWWDSVTYPNKTTIQTLW